MSDDEENEYEYIQVMKAEIQYEEFITKLEDNCCYFYDEMRLYLDYIGVCINPKICCVDIYNFIETEVLKKPKNKPKKRLEKRYEPFVPTELTSLSKEIIKKSKIKNQKSKIE